MLFQDPVEEWKWHVRRRMGRGPVPWSQRRWGEQPWLVAIVALVVLAAIVLRPPMILLAVALATIRAVVQGFRQVADARSGISERVGRAERHLRNGEYHLCKAVALRGLADARLREHRANLCKVLAWAAIASKDPFLAHGAMLELPAREIDLHLLTSYLTCCNRTHEAAELLDEARCACRHESSSTQTAH